MGPGGGWLMQTPEEEDAAAGDEYVLAKTYFDLGEYRRCAHHLADNTTPIAWFLRCYALYLAGEKRKSEEVLEVAGASGTGAAAGAVVQGPRKDVVNHDLDAVLEVGMCNQL